MLNELVGDKSLERFRQEYDKLHNSLKKAHENEKRLIKKCRFVLHEFKRERGRDADNSVSLLLSCSDVGSTQGISCSLFWVSTSDSCCWLFAEVFTF